MGLARDAYNEARNSLPFRRASDALIRLHEEMTALSREINAGSDIKPNVYATTKIENSRFSEILYMEGKQPRVFFLEAKHDGTLQLDLLNDLNTSNPSYCTACYSVDDPTQMESLEVFLGRTLNNFARQSQGIQVPYKPHSHLVSA